MKKILSAFSSLILISGSTTTVVSCGTKPVDSLSSILLTDGEHSVIDISGWNSDVISSNAVKENFLKNLDDGLHPEVNIHSFLDLLTVNNNNKNDKNYFAHLVNNYEDSTNQQKQWNKISKKSTEELFQNNLQFNVYDENNNDTKIASSSGNKLLPLKDKNGKYYDVTIAKNNSTDVLVVNLEIELLPIIDSKNDNVFVGAKTNVKKDQNTGWFDSSKYYNHWIVNGSDELKKEAKLSGDNKDFKLTKEYDYRYKIEFYFKAS